MVRNGEIMDQPHVPLQQIQQLHQVQIITLDST
jgi:hypothetical protein